MAEGKLGARIRKYREQLGLTQEELASALYVSRTAVSKWESGKGYPSIDSLKEISKFFSVSIDELLSGEKLIYIAEKENRTKVKSLCDSLFAAIDIMAVLLILLPLYPKHTENLVYSVNLFSHTDISQANLILHLIMFTSLVLLGVIKYIICYVKCEKAQNLITVISMITSIITVLFLVITREVYASVTAFLLLLIKGMIIIYKGNKKTFVELYKLE